MAENRQSLTSTVNLCDSSAQDVALRPALGAVLMIGAILLFAAIALESAGDARLAVLNTRVANWLHQHPSALVTQAMLAVSYVHGTAGILALAFVIAVFLVRSKDWYWLLALGFSVPGGLLLNAFLKHVFQRVRPGFDDPIVTLATYSFPSGHTAGTTVFYGFVAALLLSRVHSPRRRAAIVALALAMVGLVGFSRIYLGAHYLGDVIAAFAAGVAWLALCLMAVDALRRHRATGRSAA